MQILYWILALVGVALIYPVPYIVQKAGLSQNLNTPIKIVGIILSLIGLIMLYRTGGFN